MMIVKATEQAVEKTVNGKINALRGEVSSFQLDMREHIEKTAPVLEGLAGAKILGETLKWLAGIAAAWILLSTFIKSILNP